MAASLVGVNTISSATLWPSSLTLSVPPGTAKGDRLVLHCLALLPPEPPSSGIIDNYELPAPWTLVVNASGKSGLGPYIGWHTYTQRWDGTLPTFRPVDSTGTLVTPTSPAGWWGAHCVTITPSYPVTSYGTGSGNNANMTQMQNVSPNTGTGTYGVQLSALISAAAGRAFGPNLNPATTDRATLTAGGHGLDTRLADAVFAVTQPSASYAVTGSGAVLIAAHAVRVSFGPDPDPALTRGFRHIGLVRGARG